MTLDQVKRILYDLALTIQVHPLALGVLTEDSGRFYLPDGVIIEATIIRNVIAYHKSSESAEYRARQVTKASYNNHTGNVKNIPQLVEKLKVSDIRLHFITFYAKPPRYS